MKAGGDQAAASPVVYDLYAGGAELYTAIGRRVRSIRRVRQLTQQDLAESIQRERTSVANIEAGRQRFPVHVLYDLAAALGVSPSELLPD